MFTNGQEFITGRALRHLFAMALQKTTIGNQLKIWGQFGGSFCDNLSHLLRTGRVIVPPDVEGMEAELSLDYGLYYIQQLLYEYGKSLDEFGLPRPVLNWQDTEGYRVGNTLVREEIGYEMEQQRELADLMRGRLKEQQLASFDAIVATVNSHDQYPQLQRLQSTFFLHGPAGTGKTFLYNCLCSHLRVQGKLVLCVASWRIAAQLLPGGITAHSRFKIPLSNNLNAVCNITPNSHLGLLIQKASLII